jgi:hypothetical protein
MLTSNESFKILTKIDFLPGGRFHGVNLQQYHTIPRSIVYYVYGCNYLPAELERSFKAHLLDIMSEIDEDYQQHQQQQQQKQQQLGQEDVDETDSRDSGYQSSQAY